MYICQHISIEKSAMDICWSLYQFICKKYFWVIFWDCVSLMSVSAHRCVLPVSGPCPTSVCGRSRLHGARRHYRPMFLAYFFHTNSHRHKIIDHFELDFVESWNQVHMIFVGRFISDIIELFWYYRIQISQLCGMHTQGFRRLTKIGQQKSCRVRLA